MSKHEAEKDELRKLLATMDVPEDHKADVLWLATRLGNRNHGHANLPRAEDLIFLLLRANVTTL